MNYKLALFIGSLTGGGAERVTCNLANYLSEKGYDIDLITMSDVNDTYMLNRKVNRVYLIHANERKNKLSDLLLRRRRLKKYIKENKDVDCYVTMLPITCFLLTSLKKYITCKVIISERNNPASYNFINKLLMKYSAKKCDGLVVQTTVIGEWYNNNNNKVVIPNAINSNVILKGSNKKENKIVSVGRLEKQKNYPMLIKAYNIFSKKCPNYILEIYGQGNLKHKLERLVKKYNLQNKVFFKGYVNNVTEMIYNSKMFIMTSNFEGMPNALIEAMCLGLPCISTDCDGGGARELIDNMENGILIQKNNIQELVSSMIKIIDNPSYAYNISKEAKKLKEKLSYDRIYDDWEKYIIKIMNNL